MHVNPTDLAVFAGALIPLAVAALAKFHAPSWAKSYMLVALTAISAVVAQVATDNGDFTVKGVLLQFAKTFVVAISALYGVYKPIGLADKVKDKTKNVGIGPVVDPPPPGA